MSNIDCSACTELNEYGGEFLTKGVTNTVATSLKNNTGLNPSLSVLHKNCEDLNDVNDCLIGRLQGEVKAYDVCDWKKFMAKSLPNFYEMLKAMIASQCGLWARVKKLECMIDTLTRGFSFKLGESTQTGTSHIVAGKGVSYLVRGQGEHESDAHIVYIGGGMMMAYGNLDFYTVDFTDADGTQRDGNPVWGQQGGTAVGNELILEYRVKMSEYPQIRSFHRGFGEYVNNGNNSIFVTIFTGGDYAYGQHGGCNISTGEPSREGYSQGILVPDGWSYIQLRANYIETPVSGEHLAATPRCIFGVRLNPDEIEC